MNAADNLSSHRHDQDRRRCCFASSISSNNIPSFFLLLFVCLSVVLTMDVAESTATTSSSYPNSWPSPPNIDEQLLGIIQTSIDVSVLVQFPEEFGLYDVIDITDSTVGDVASIYGEDSDLKIYEITNHSKYESVILYSEEPDLMGVIKQRNNEMDGEDSASSSSSSSSSSCTCYLAFRGTMNNVQDWLQNFDVRKTVLYGSGTNGTGDDECTTRKGFTNYLERDNWSEALYGLKSCLLDDGNGNGNDDDDDDSLLSPDNATSYSCDLIITGHSQGGAQALIASAMLSEVVPVPNPTKVITFGQIPVLDSNCPYIDSNNVYRFVNTIVKAPLTDIIPSISEIIPEITINNPFNNSNSNSNNISSSFISTTTTEYENNKLLFDLVPFSPSIVWGDHYGFGFLLGPNENNDENDDDDSSSDNNNKTIQYGNINIKYFAWNNDTIFDTTDTNTTDDSTIISSRVVPVINTDIRAHDVSPSMSNHSYWNRIHSLKATAAPTISGIYDEEEEDEDVISILGTNGFTEGTPCEPYFYDVCESMTCIIEENEVDDTITQQSQSNNNSIFNRPTKFITTWKCGEVMLPNDDDGGNASSSSSVWTSSSPSSQSSLSIPFIALALSSSLSFTVGIL
jgi:hypothetical protein